MATVEYQVLRRYINPNTGKSITNNSKKDYNVEKFVKKYESTEALAENKDVSEQNASSNEKFNMLFYYNGVKPVNDFLDGAELYSRSDDNPCTVISDDFKRCNGQAWFVVATKGSLIDALNIAENLVKTIGKENVKVVKNVPLKLSVGIE